MFGGFFPIDIRFDVHVAFVLRAVIMDFHTDVLHLGYLFGYVFHSHSLVTNRSLFDSWVFIGFLCAHDIDVDIFSAGILYFLFVWTKKKEKELLLMMIFWKR